jgi:hypothetical protein
MKRLFITIVLLMLLYSLVLMIVELRTSQEFVRNFFTDIDGPVPFFAINTTLSVFLLWSTALMFLVCIACGKNRTSSFVSRRFFVTQMILFGYLGADDRFKLHEHLGWWLSVPDHFILITVAAIEIILLVTIGRHLLTSRALTFLMLACAFFAVMIVIDAWVPHDLLLRLTLEDLSKTWSALFFFMFSWSVFEQCLDDLMQTREI